MTTNTSEHSGPGSGDLILLSDAVIQDGIKGYAAADQDDLLWLIGYARAELGNSRTELCERLECDWTTAVRIFTGKYGAGIAGFMEKVRDLKRRALEGGNSGFAETIVTKKIFEAMDYALAGDVDGGNIVVIIGPARRGKTRTAQEWVRQNRGRAVYVDCPATGGQGAFIRELATATGNSKHKNITRMSAALFDCLNRRRALVVDEVSRIVPATDRSRPVALEFIRRLHDEQRCPVVLIVTPQTWMEIEHGALARYFEQLIGRVDLTVNIPDAVRRDEVRAILAKNGAKNADAELMTAAMEIAGEKGRLGTLLKDLRKARKLSDDGELQAKHLRAAKLHRSKRGVWPADEREGA